MTDRPSLSSRSATLRSGVRLDVAEGGEASGIPVVLLHGLTDSWRSFAGMMVHLPTSLHAIAPSLRGHGDSDRPEDGYAPADFATDVAALLDALGIARAVIVGHSMGATVAMRFALDHAERVQSLVLLGAFAAFQDNPEVAALRDAVAMLGDPVDAGFAREFQTATVARPVADGLIDVAVSESLKVPSRVWRAALAGLIADDAGRQLHRIVAPSLLVWGDRDAFVPRADQDVLARGIRDARLIVHAGAGHALHWEDPARAARETAAFVLATR